MEKVWLKSYPKEVPSEITLDRYNSISDLFKESAKKFSSRSAFICMDVHMTYAELDRQSRNFAAYLQKVCGLKKGDRVAIMMPNVLQYPVCIFGALRAGLVVVNTNPLYTAREAEHQFKDSGAVALVVMANFCKVIEDVIPKTSIKHVIVTEIGDMLGFPKSLIVNFVVKYVKKMIPAFHIPQAVKFNVALAKGAEQNVDEPKIESSDIAFLQYTGGTTGVSKGAVLTHRNLVSNMEQVHAWIGPWLKMGEEIIVTPLPLYHIFSLSVNCLTFIRMGATNLLITNPKDIPAFVKDLSKYPFTALTCVNTLCNALLANEDFRKLNFKSMKISVGGGMAVQTAVAKKWKEVTGVALSEGFGLTESSPVLTVNPLDGREKPGSIGLPMPNTDIRIVDDDGKDVAMGSPGELWASGPQIMAGYWQRPDETAKTIENGWLKTGDIAVMHPDGFFQIVDRKKDMILVSGFNVYPNEVEDVVAMHPKVLEVAAIGVPDEKSGEAVKICVVKRDQSLTAEELKAFCKENLTGYKLPRHVEFRTELPKTNVGKILRRALKEAPAKTT